MATHVPDDATATPDEPADRRDLAFRAEPPQQPGAGAPILEPQAPAPEGRPIEESHGRPEVVPIARPLTPSPPLPAERALPPRPALAEKQPLLQIDQIDVLVTDPAPMPTAPARARFAAVATNRRYLRRL